MNKQTLIKTLKEITKTLEASDKELYGYIVWDGNDNWEATGITLNEYDGGFDLEVSLAGKYEVSLTKVEPDEVVKRPKSFYPHAWTKVCYYYPSFEYWMENVMKISLEEYETLEG